MSNNLERIIMIIKETLIEEIYLSEDAIKYKKDLLRALMIEINDIEEKKKSRE